jgi:hypothetical protein
VSDRAQALIKLAETCLVCLSIPDAFHLIHDLVKSYSLAIWSRLRQARQALSHAQENLALCHASPPSGAAVQQAQVLVAASEAEVTRWEGGYRTYRYYLEQLSLLVTRCVWGMRPVRPPQTWSASYEPRSLL